MRKSERDGEREESERVPRLSAVQQAVSKGAGRRKKPWKEQGSLQDVKMSSRKRVEENEIS